MKYIFASNNAVNRVMILLGMLFLFGCNGGKNESVENGKAKTEVAKTPEVEAFILAKSNLSYQEN